MKRGEDAAWCDGLGFNPQYHTQKYSLPHVKHIPKFLILLQQEVKVKQQQLIMSKVPNLIICTGYR